MDQTQARPAATTGAPTLARVFAAAMGLLILLQGFLGGRGFFVDTGLLDVHQIVGIIFFIVAVVQIWVVMMTIRTAERGMLLGMSGLILVLTVVQLGLGFSAKDGSGEAAAWHLFNAVLLTGVIAAYANTVFFRLKSR